MKFAAKTATVTLSVLAASTMSAPAAHARVADTVVTYTDRSGDVSLVTPNSRPVFERNSIDLKAVTYRIDRTAKTLTVTYRVPTVFTAAQSENRGITQQFSTAVLDGSKTFWIDSTNTSTKIVTTNNAGRVAVCGDGKSTASPTKDTLTQKMPLSCITPSSGNLSSGTFLLSGQGPLFQDAGSWLSMRFAL